MVALPEGVVLWSAPVVLELLPVLPVLAVPWSVVLGVLAEEPLVDPAPPEVPPVPVCAKAIAPETNRIPVSVSILFICIPREFF